MASTETTDRVIVGYCIRATRRKTQKLKGPLHKYSVYCCFWSSHFLHILYINTLIMMGILFPRDLKKTSDFRQISKEQDNCQLTQCDEEKQPSYHASSESLLI